MGRRAEICRALDEKPQDVLARVEQRLYPADDDKLGPGSVKLDLAQVAACADSRLLPLRRWADHRLREDTTRSDITLTPAAVELLAELYDMTLDDITDLARAAYGERGHGP